MVCPHAHGLVVGGDVGHIACHQAGTLGVQLQLMHTVQQLGHAVLHDGVGKLQILRVFGQAQHQTVLLFARPEQHPRMVKKLRQTSLYMAHRPLLQDILQARAGGHRHPLHRALERNAVRIGIALACHAVAVPRHAQTQGIGFGLPLAQQGYGLAHAAVCAQPAHTQGLAHKRSLQIEIVAGATQADTDDIFHGVPNRCYGCTVKPPTAT